MHYLIAILLSLSTVSAQLLVYPDQFETMVPSSRRPYYPSAPSLSPQGQSIPSSYPGGFGGGFGGGFSRPSSPYPRPITQRPKAVQTSQPNPYDTKLPGRWNNHVTDLISRGVLKFSLDMDRAIYATRNSTISGARENTLFSPLSLTGTLAMVLLGSAGVTFQQVSRILGLESGVNIAEHSEVVHQMFGLLLKIVREHTLDPSEPLVNFASGIFVQDGYPIRPEFGNISQQVYNSETINLDFLRQSGSARQKINTWVNDRTNGKIHTILSDDPHPATKVIIASALYFLGEWQQHFIDGATKRKQFFIEPNEAIEVDMMYNGGEFNFYEDKSFGAKIVALPYKGRKVTMYIVLPDAPGARALRNFENSLTAEIIETMIARMTNQTCIFALPKMKLSSSLRLSSALQTLGLTSLFDPAAADLSILSAGPNENLSDRFTPNHPIGPLPTYPSGNVNQPQYYPGRSDQDNDVLIFSRFGGDDDSTEDKKGEEPNEAQGRANYFRYIDPVGGYDVRQWSNGFIMKKLIRNRRSSRSKRQNRPINGDFLDYLKSQNFPSYGLDSLRNNPAIRNPHLYATEVLHKVEMDVTETGTEAAAATAVSLERTGGQKTLIANRPFLMFIRHDVTKLILFWGNVNVPTPNYSNAS